MQQVRAVGLTIAVSRGAQIPCADGSSAGLAGIPLLGLVVNLRLELCQLGSARDEFGE
jgi:hypothetical protein